jgi:hypothetical protein
MYIHQCVKCNEEQKYIKKNFDTILCYRHWYQNDKPKPEIFGSYEKVVNTIKNETNK